MLRNRELYGKSANTARKITVTIYMRRIQLLPLLFASQMATAAFTVEALVPVGATNSFGRGLTATTKVGTASFTTSGGNSVSRATIWDSAGLSVSYNPAEGVNSSATGISGNQITGNLINNGESNAFVWNMFPNGGVNLHPTNFVASFAWATDGSKQVGSVVSAVPNPGGGAPSRLFRAALWNGTASSFINLNPSGATSSEAFGIGGGKQVGRSLFGANNIATMWDDTADSAVLLGPANVTSSAYATDGTNTVGIVNNRAALWTSQSQAYIDLHPTGYSSSDLFTLGYGYQGGSVTQGSGPESAAIWSGTSGSMINLGAFLPGYYGRSIVRGIYSDGTTLTVFGAARDTRLPGEHYNAIVWTSPVPEPSSLAILGMGVAIFKARRAKAKSKL